MLHSSALKSLVAIAATFSTTSALPGIIDLLAFPINHAVCQTTPESPLYKDCEKAVEQVVDMAENSLGYTENGIFPIATVESCKVQINFHDGTPNTCVGKYGIFETPLKEILGKCGGNEKVTVSGYELLPLDFCEATIDIVKASS
jgi:hypothetical protein